MLVSQTPDARGEPGDGGRADAIAPTVAPKPQASVAVPALDDVEHMCALLTTCDKVALPPGLVPRDFVGCVRAMYTELASPSAAQFSLTLRECGLRASSCGELRTCALRGARPDVCTGKGKSGPVDFCDADGRAVTCNAERATLVRDCPRGGEQCVVRDGKAACALGACGADAPPVCSNSGTRILECKKGRLSSLDCGAFGLTCTSTSEGPRCATSGASCTEGTTRCEGATAFACWHGHEVGVDCGAAGLACAGGSRGTSAVGTCAAPPPQPGAQAGSCDPSSPPRCDGATISWCAWGTPRKYLCKSMGLSRCVADDKGVGCK
ncbi:hypothetical protein AKJ09_10203 [Labilithrix luteola]|uniref:Uncharacterized protein n=1 Tax=Labilithrix luteola TaxID=1391654 RepID=A0A0K1QDM9_9BACT|nr:hypothetical protein [Labilithrix luteola]AKV03540.1 hypothetical protein AKJ09_10203 [Labilithrix luteola]